MVNVRKGWFVTGVVIMLLAGYVLLLKPFFLDQGLSEDEKSETNQALNAIIEDVQRKKSFEDANQTATESHSEDTLATESEDHERVPDEDAAENVDSDATKESEPEKTAEANENLTEDTIAKETPEIEKISKIEEKYISGLTDIKLTAEKLVNNLVDEAKYEYQNLSEAEKKDMIVAGKLASKYMSRANELEAMIDDTVERLLVEYKEELKSNGLSTESVQLLRAQYETEKKERRETLLNKALHYQP